MELNDYTQEDMFKYAYNLISQSKEDNNMQTSQQKYDKGISIINNLSMDGFPDAQIYIGDFLYHVMKNPKEAYEYYAAASENGSFKGQYMVSIFLNKGLACIQNKEKAFNIMYSLAQQKIDYAQLDLALFYLNGEGCEKNLNKAFKYFNLAAKQGHPVAQNELGLCYLNAEGIIQNYLKAFYWFNEAAKNNNSDGYHNMACMFMEGTGIQKNIENALNCLVVGARLGNSHCINFLNSNNIDSNKYIQNISVNFNIELNEDILESETISEENSLHVVEEPTNQSNITTTKEDHNSQKMLSPSFEIFLDFFSCNPNNFMPNDLNEVCNGQTPLMMALGWDNFNFSDEQWDYLFKNSNLKFYYENEGEKCSLFVYAVCSENKSLKITKERLELLIKNCDLKFVDDYGYSNLMYLFRKITSVDIDIEQLSYAIRNSDLGALASDGMTPLSILLSDFEKNTVFSEIDDSLWRYIFEKSKLETSIYIDKTLYDILGLINRISYSDWKEYLISVYNDTISARNNKLTIEEYKEKAKSIIGLKEVKESFNTLINLYEFNKNNNLSTKTHMRLVFVGNHGTGKSLISEHIASLYNTMGILQHKCCNTVFNQFFFLENKDLNFYNQKTIYCKFDSKIKYEANNELLMIDTLKTLGDSTLFILSITPEDLEDIKVKYPKFYSLFTKIVNFPDYTSEDLVEMSKNMSQAQGFCLSDEASVKLKSFYEHCKKNKSTIFSNAYLVTNALTKIIESHVNSNKNDLVFLAEDVPSVEVKTEEHSIENLLQELNCLTGLDSVKNTLLEYIALVRANKRRGTNLTTNMHLVFTGNPGTGKTTVARLIGKIYKALGLLSEGHVVETDRSGLVAGYIGQTAIKTKEIINKSMGGILFIDEAYTLNNGGGSQHDFGKESIDTLLKFMEDYRKDFAVIVAGYPKEMENFIDLNPGLKSRFPKTVLFEDYSTEQLIEILINICNKEKLKYDNGFLLEAEKYLNNIMNERDKNTTVMGFVSNAQQTNKFSDKKSFGNAREVRTLFEKTLEKQAIRIMNDACADPWLLTKDDILELAKSKRNK